jgi:hypothetical protein
VAGADGAAVLVPIPVEDVVATVLDGSVAAVEGRYGRSACGCRGMAGDAVDGFGRGLAGGLLDGGARDDKDLANAGKVEVAVECGVGPNGALLDAAMGQSERLGEVGFSTALEEETDVFAQGRRKSHPIQASRAAHFQAAAENSAWPATHRSRWRHTIGCGRSSAALRGSDGPPSGPGRVPLHAQQPV